MIDQLDILMAYRYLYYHIADSIITDQAYDKLEKEYLKRGDIRAENPILKPGSDNPKDYTSAQIILANYLVIKKYE